MGCLCQLLAWTLQHLLILALVIQHTVSIQPPVQLLKLLLSAAVVAWTPHQAKNLNLPKFTMELGMRNDERGPRRFEAVPSPHSSILNPRSSLLNPQFSILNPQSSVLNPQFLMPGCNKLYKCGSQKISKQSTFVAGRLKTSCFAPKTLIYGIFVANVSRIFFEKTC